MLGVLNLPSLNFDNQDKGMFAEIATYCNVVPRGNFSSNSNESSNQGQLFGVFIYVAIPVGTAIVQRGLG